jgi:hypothetical protein
MNSQSNPKHRFNDERPRIKTANRHADLKNRPVALGQRGGGAIRAHQNSACARRGAPNRLAIDPMALQQRVQIVLALLVRRRLKQRTCNGGRLSPRVGLTTSSCGDAPIPFSPSMVVDEAEEACPNLDWARDMVKRRGDGRF